MLFLESPDFEVAGLMLTSARAVIIKRKAKRVAEGFYSKVLAGDFDEEYRIVDKNKNIHWVRHRGFPLRNMHGETYRVGLLVEEITDRKREHETLKISREKYHELYAASPEAILLLDPETGKPYQWNKGFEELLGYPSEQLSLLRFSDIESGDSPMDVKQILAQVKRGEVKELNTSYFNNSGQAVDVFVQTARQY